MGGQAGLGRPGGQGWCNKNKLDFFPICPTEEEEEEEEEEEKMEQEKETFWSPLPIVLMRQMDFLILSWFGRETNLFQTIIKKC